MGLCKHVGGHTPYSLPLSVAMPTSISPSVGQRMRQGVFSAAPQPITPPALAHVFAPKLISWDTQPSHCKNGLAFSWLSQKVSPNQQAHSKTSPSICPSSGSIAAHNIQQKPDCPLTEAHHDQHSALKMQTASQRWSPDSPFASTCCALATKT